MKKTGKRKCFFFPCCYHIIIRLYSVPLIQWRDSGRNPICSLQNICTPICIRGCWWNWSFVFLLPQAGAPVSGGPHEDSKWWCPLELYRYVFNFFHTFLFVPQNLGSSVCSPYLKHNSWDLVFFVLVSNYAFLWAHGFIMWVTILSRYSELPNLQ